VYGWRKVPDGGWLTGRPAYESPDGRFMVAQDYDDLDTGSQELMWFVHNDDGFLTAHDTLRDAVASYSAKADTQST
jgi:hypothetical protein